MAQAVSTRPNAPPILVLDPSQEREVTQRPLDWKIVRRIFSYTTPYAKKRNALFGLVLLRAIQIPILSWVVASLVSGPIARHDLKTTARGVGGFFALVVITDVIFHYRMRLALELGESVVRDLRNHIFRHLLTLPMSFFHRTKLGRIIGRVTSDVDAVRTGVQDVAFVTVVQGGTMLVAMSLMLHYDWLLFLVVLTMAPPLWWLVRYFRQKLTVAHRSTIESFTRVTATLAESVTGIRITQGFVRQDINGGLFRSLIQDHSQLNMDVARHSAVFLPLLEFNGQLFLAILLCIGGYQALGGHIGLPALIQFFFLSNLFFNPVQVLGNQYNQALQSMASAERIFQLLDAKPDWTDAPGAVDIPRIEGRVEFRNLSFAYTRDKVVLNDLSFVIEPGQTVALVGHTGSGKTSITNLIAKLYLPTSGQLLIDGREIRDISGASLHRQMGSVLQNNFLWSGTVIDNIRVAKPEATDEQIVEAARALDVLDIIEDLPNGLHTAVGEKGAGLSLGQRQIICFTRAMLAEPRLLILDEATSSIDAMTEARLQRAVAKLLRSRTSFVIAHRLSTIRHADLVLVLDHGRIVERGTHQELLAKRGTYANLYAHFVRSGQS